MKIRDKMEVATLKAKERALEVQEGAKLAKTVDALRATRAEEEEYLRKFREASLRMIKEELAGKIAQKKQLAIELEGMESRYLTLKEKVEFINNQIKDING